MEILIDTHIFIWLLHSPEKIDKSNLKILSKYENNIYISAVSIFEIEIKRHLGKLIIPDDYHLLIDKLGLIPIHFDISHALRLKQLPSIHKDPFDRMLVAQCLEKDFYFMTKDELIAAYPIKCLKIK